LIAVYDIRRTSSIDLQGDIDVGISRSPDGGETWEPMKVIMDMGNWGGLPENQNGIGDPCILVDTVTNTIWVAALWAHGMEDKRTFNASQHGLSPEVTGQLVLVNSKDDGLTWSKPIVITSQVKNPDWYLLLPGPGKGITMSDGTLVLPAQFRDKEKIPSSTIIWSIDKGKSWNIGTAAKSNTTEAQVVELSDGSLMLNMRDNRGGSRAVAVTRNLGKTWEEHPSSNHALIEPICMASLIKHKTITKEILLFSNPSSTTGRHHMTIKASLDEGQTWQEKYWKLLDELSGRGYSCLTSVDENTIGILYEGSQADLVYEKISLDEIIKE